MSDTQTSKHLESLPEEHRQHAKKKMESLHLQSPEATRPLWDVDTEEVDRSVEDISKFIELSVKELGPDASRSAVEKYSLELASHYALAAQTWAENSPESEEARHDAEKAMESLLIWSMLRGERPIGEDTGIQPLIDRGYGVQLMSAAHRMAERGLVVQTNEGWGTPTYAPVSRAMRHYQGLLSFTYGQELDPTLSDEYFGRDLTAEEQAVILGSLSANEIEMAYGITDPDPEKSERAEALAEAYLGGMATNEYGELDDRRAAAMIQRIGAHFPSILTAKETDGYMLKLLSDRSVGTDHRYIQNNQTALRTHFLIARILADPQSPEVAKSFALAMISDNPQFEEYMETWPLDFIEASEEGASYAKAAIRERALENEKASAELMEASELPTILGRQLDLDPETVRAVLKNYKGDHRLVLDVFESIGGTRQLEPLEVTILKSKIIGGQDHEGLDKTKGWDRDIVKWKNFFNSHMTSKLSELFPTGLPENLQNSVANAIDLRPYTMDQFIKSVDALLGDELAAEFAEGAPLSKHADNIFSYILKTTHAEDTVENIQRIKRLKQAGLFELTLPEGVDIPMHPELIDALPANVEDAVEELRTVLSSSILIELLRDSPSDQNKELIIEDVVMHYETWGRAFTSQRITSIDRDLLAFVKKKVYSEGLPVSSLFEAIASLQVMDEKDFDNTILRSLIDRQTIDKLPTNPTKLADRIPDQRARELYAHILELKSKQPGISSDEIYEFLLTEGLMTAEETATLQGIDMSEKPDLTRLLVDKKSLLEDYKVRNRWLSGAYPDASLQMLASAWSSRAEALAYGIADNPYEIIRWTAVQRFYELAAAETELIGGRSFTELLQEQGELAYELARSYPIETSFSVMRKYLVAKTEGAFYRSEFTPGSTNVEYEGKKYAVEWLPKGSPYFFSMGVDTGCCMTIGGASESCIWQAMNDPNYGGMLVRVDGKVRAQSVGYLAKDETGKGTLVLDNIEVNAGTDERAMREVYKIALMQLLDEGKINRTVRQVNIGEGYTKVPFKDLESVLPVEGPKGVYTDARQQRRLLVRS